MEKEQVKQEEIEKDEAAVENAAEDDQEVILEDQGSTPEEKQEEGKEAELLKKEMARIKIDLEALKKENSDLKDQYLRKQADFENFRKRMQREKQDFMKYSNTDLLMDLVSTIDDFERAIQSSEASEDFTSFHDGIVLIEKQFVNMLETKWGLKRFTAKGEVFDPQKHEALMMEDSHEHEESTVLEDFQKGYMLHERVVRPAKVKVSNPVAKPEGSEETSEEVTSDSE